MNRFVDEAVIEICSGDGGNGVVHFRREKYVPKGGPDGGDGGNGGDVVFIVRRNLKTLSQLKMRRVYRAGKGESGSGQRRHGKNGNDVLIPVPPGTLLKEADGGEIITDLISSDESWTCLKGGRGGKGNWHFRNPVRQAPNFAQTGQLGTAKRVLLELNLIADVGLVGLPNAGKSTLLSVLTRTHPKIASYPFTTLIPNIGVMHFYDRDVLIADIPGIIEGAAHGAGLGVRFLKHINRTRILAFLIDLSDDAFAEGFHVLQKELSSYSGELLTKPRIIVGTKMDLECSSDHLAPLVEICRPEKVMGISAVDGTGIEELKKLLSDLTFEM